MSSGSEKRARETYVRFRVTPEEKAEVDQKAERAGLTIGSYARRTLLDAVPPRQVRRPVAEREVLARLLAELGKVGSNLNQLARAANSGEIIYDSEVQSALLGLGEVRDAILVALGREP